MKTRILYLEHCTDHTIGGSHYCLLEICRALDKDRYEAVVAFYEGNDLTEAFERTGAQVLVLEPFRPFRAPGPLKPLSPLVNLYRMLVARSLMWRRELKRQRIDIVHLNNCFTTDHDLIIAGKSLGLVLISHVRGIQRDLGALGRFFGEWLDAIIVISETVRRNILELGMPDRNLHLIYDGISAERIVSQSRHDVRERHGVPADAPVVGIVGNVKTWKGQETLVRAMGILRARYPNLYCFVVGAIADPDYHARLAQLCRDTGIQERVIFAGYQSNVADYLRSFDVFVHASIEPEPFGIVILEAMVLHKPVIATDLGAPREIIVDGTSGLLYPAGDPGALAECLGKLLDDPALRERIGAAGHARFEAQFTSAINIAQIERIYSDCLSDRLRG